MAAMGKEIEKEKKMRTTNSQHRHPRCIQLDTKGVTCQHGFSGAFYATFAARLQEAQCAHPH